MFNDEVQEAKKYIETKLRPCEGHEEAWDLFQRSTLGVSFYAFATALGTMGRVRMTDGRGSRAKKR